MASGHQSRPASARAASSVTTAAPLGRDALEQAGRDLDQPRREAVGDRAGFGVDRGDRRGRRSRGSSPAVSSSFWQER